MTDRDHRRGPQDAPVTLVEYGDYQCPACARAHHEVATLLDEIDGKAQFVFRHLPLPNVHEHALAAANAAESAGAQGAFWPMHDWLYANQPRLGSDWLDDAAAATGVDGERLRADVAGALHAPRIEHDLDSALRSGANGTPTFFVAGHRHDGAYDAASLAEAVNAALDDPDERPG